MDIFGAIGAINALLLALLLFKAKNKTASDKILIAWVLNFFLYFGFYLLYERYTTNISVFWLPVSGISLISHPIFLFVYALSLSKKSFVFNFKIVINFLVVILWLVSMIPYLLMSPDEQQRLVYDKQSLSFEIFLPMMAQICVELFYFIRALIVLIQHQNNIDQEFSYHEKINLDWLKILTYLYIVILVSNVVGYTLVSSNYLNVKVMDDLLMIVRFLLFFYLIYHGYKQRLIYRTDNIVCNFKK